MTDFNTFLHNVAAEYASRTDIELRPTTTLLQKFEHSQPLACDTYQTVIAPSSANFPPNSDDYALFQTGAGTLFYTPVSKADYQRWSEQFFQYFCPEGVKTKGTGDITSTVLMTSHGPNATSLTPFNTAAIKMYELLVSRNIFTSMEEAEKSILFLFKDRESVNGLRIPPNIQLDANQLEGISDVVEIENEPLGITFRMLIDDIRSKDPSKLWELTID